MNLMFLEFPRDQWTTYFLSLVSFASFLNLIKHLFRMECFSLEEITIQCCFHVVHDWSVLNLVFEPSHSKYTCPIFHQTQSCGKLEKKVNQSMLPVLHCLVLLKSLEAAPQLQSVSTLTITIVVHQSSYYHYFQPIYLGYYTFFFLFPSFITFISNKWNHLHEQLLE